jgi:hypothetical protein
MNLTIHLVDMRRSFRGISSGYNIMVSIGAFIK